MPSAATSPTIALISFLLFRLTAPHRALGLFSLKNGLALLHEGSAALDVILALETGLDERRACLRVGRLARFQELAHDALARADGERRVLRDHRAVLEHQGLELADRRHAVNETHGLRFVGLELAPGDQYLAGEGRPQDIDEIFQGGRAVAETQLCRGNAEARILGRDPEVRAQGDVDPR